MDENIIRQTFSCLPRIPYPLIRPSKNGYYLVHDKTEKVWRVAEWKLFNYASTRETWQGGYDVDEYIPFLLKEQ